MWNNELVLKFCGSMNKALWNLYWLSERMVNVLQLDVFCNSQVYKYLPFFCLSWLVPRTGEESCGLGTHLNLNFYMRCCWKVICNDKPSQRMQSGCCASFVLWCTLNILCWQLDWLIVYLVERVSTLYLSSLYSVLQPFIASYTWLVCIFFNWGTYWLLCFHKTNNFLCCCQFWQWVNALPFIFLLTISYNFGWELVIR